MSKNILFMLDEITVRDERVMRKILTAMTDYKISLPRLIAQVISIGEHMTGPIFSDTTPFHEQDLLFEKALDRYIEIARKN